MKKIIALLFLVSFTTLLIPVAYAANCNASLKDEDGDGWVSNYHDGYKLYTPAGTESIGDECTLPGTVLKKKIGDCADIKPGEELNPNSTKVVRDKNGKLIKSNSIYPEAFDTPGDGVDQSCAGQDSTVGGNTSTTAEGVLDNIRTFLTWVVGGISGIILIIGGIMYAMAAGDEQKTKRARKAIIGAVVGLVVALLANVIISIVAQNIVK